VNERNSNNKSLKENVEKTTNKIKVFQIVGMEQMDQRSVVLFLRLKGLSEKVIHHELVAVLQENAVSYLSMTRVTRFSREAILDLNSDEASSSPKDDGLDEVK
jgi:carbamoylphosphate synthase small subunit